MSSQQSLLVVITLLGTMFLLSDISSAEQFEEAECNLVEQTAGKIGQEKPTPTAPTMENEPMVEQKKITPGIFEEDEESDHEQPQEAEEQKKIPGDGYETYDSEAQRQEPKQPSVAASESAEPQEEPDTTNTYSKTNEAIDKALRKADDIEDPHLKAEVQNYLTAYLKNTVISVVSTMEFFSKVQPCLKDLDKDVSEIVSSADKAFKDCMSQGSGTHTNCVDAGKAGQVDKIINIYNTVSNCAIASETQS
ncbi:30 kDa salivary gland allergen Aed a 3-like isoform X2 [Uranotaenia lowii]|uniref:30 kDa salivary gland allergen Aed a 3-like isoform X2 n=1 Tax=Uranotaenia lowii TaxID=190385 RepID=UPI002478AFDC|nr:30 kDa salivary gland allergen Aed a 3-like isoform X2 [Uranotaenia lowii]